MVMNRILIGFFALLSVNTIAYAASIDGTISASEYQWNTNGSEGSDKWYTHGGNQELNDESGGDKYAIEFLGTNISDGKFQFGATGGEILSGRKVASTPDIYLSDFAISVNNKVADPTLDSSAFDYAIRLLNVDDNSGVAEFALLSGGNWEAANIYNDKYAPKHKTETYRMENAQTISIFEGKWSPNGGDTNVLEGEFDISWLSIFDPSVGGTLSTYITMACVNDEALVHADVSAVPVPAAIWLFAPALVGFMGLRRRQKI